MGTGVSVMAEMLVRNVDKVSDDPRKDARLTKRGDVIVVCEDGWPWSAAESAGNPWAIVKVPGASVDDLASYLAEEPDDGTPKLRARRAFRFALDRHDGKPLLPEQAQALRERKQLLRDPDVLD